MAKYDRGTARMIGQAVREFQEGEHGAGEPRQRIAHNRKQAIALALAKALEERSAEHGRRRAEP